MRSQELELVLFIPVTMGGYPLTKDMIIEVLGRYIRPQWAPTQLLYLHHFQHLQTEVHSIL